MAIKTGVRGFAHGHVNAYCKQWSDNLQMGVSVTAGWDHDAERPTSPSWTVVEISLATSTEHRFD